MVTVWDDNSVSGRQDLQPPGQQYRFYPISHTWNGEKVEVICKPFAITSPRLCK